MTTPASRVMAEKIRENLIAAKALIDTPEKFEALGKSHSAALFQACADWREFIAAETVFANIRTRSMGYVSLTDRFDRAIASQGDAV